MNYIEMEKQLRAFIKELERTSGHTEFCTHCDVRREHKARLEAILESCRTSNIQYGLNDAVAGTVA